MQNSSSTFDMLQISKQMRQNTNKTSFSSSTTTHTLNYEQKQINSKKFIIYLLKGNENSDISECIDEMIEMICELRHVQAKNRINMMILGIELMLKMFVQQNETNKEVSGFMIIYFVAKLQDENYLLQKEQQSAWKSKIMESMKNYEQLQMKLVEAYSTLNQEDRIMNIFPFCQQVSSSLKNLSQIDLIDLRIKALQILIDLLKINSTPKIQKNQLLIIKIVIDAMISNLPANNSVNQLIVSYKQELQNRQKRSIHF